MERNFVKPPPGIQALIWGVRSIGAGTLLTWGLLLVIFFIVIAGLNDLIRGVRLDPLVNSSLIALFLGWLIARTRLPGKWAILILLILGSIITFLGATGMSSKLLLILRLLIQNTWDYLEAFLRREEIVADQFLQLIAADFWIELVELAARFNNWFTSAIKREAGYDPVVVTWVWSLALWCCAGWAGWAIRRWSKPVLGIAPVCILFTAVSSFVGGKSTLLIPILAAVLFLIALTAIKSSESRWRAEKIDYAEDIRLDVATTTVVLTIVLVAIAWGISEISIHKISQSIQKLAGNYTIEEGSLSDSLGLEKLPVEEGGAVFSTGVLPRSHLIGSGQELSKKLVMVAKVDDALSLPLEEERDLLPVRYYWKSLAYDIYTGHGWATSNTARINFDPHEPISTGPNPNNRIIEQNFQVIADIGSRLHTAGTLIASDREANVDIRSTDIVLQDIFAVTLEIDQKPPFDYNVTAQMPTVDAQILQNTGNDYPQWVLDRYIPLPDEIPVRVSDLAKEMTDGLPTVYDRVHAIETYLRGYPYTLDLPTPPADQDITDYFLFDLKKGFCDYYATSMVVLVRAVGIPARLITGYASGEYDAARDQYIVTEADAHSWVEVYFPDVGWVVFEPTAGLPAITRPELAHLTEIPQSVTYQSDTAFRLMLIQYRFPIILIILAGITIATVFGWALISRWRLSHMEAVETVRDVYQKLYRNGRKHTNSVNTSNTPHEFSGLLSEVVQNRFKNSRFRKPNTKEVVDFDQITDLYAKSIYSQHVVNDQDRRQVIKSWRNAQKLLLRARFVIIRNAGKVNIKKTG